MRKFKFGLIGGGLAGPLTAGALKKMPQAELTSFCDINDTLFTRYKEEFGVQKCFTDYKELIGQQELDIVCIATPPFHHKEAVLNSCKAGKHIIVEKPLAINLLEADEMTEACEKSGVQLGVIAMYRFMEPASIIKKALEEKRLGKIIGVSCLGKSFRDDAYYDSAGWRGTWWGEGGGSLISQTIHFIDLMLYFLGRVSSVQGHYRTTIHPEIEVDDMAVANLVFQNGAVGNIFSSTAAQPGYPRRLEIHGEKGTIILEEEKIVEWKVEGMEEIEFLTREGKASGDTSSKAGFVNSDYHQSQIEDFIKALEEGRKPMVDGLEGRKTLEVIRGIYQAGDRNQTIRFPVKDKKEFGKRHPLT